MLQVTKQKAGGGIQVNVIESPTLLHLFASNSPGNITFTNVVASSLSDHDMLIAVRKINARKLPPKTIECRNYAK